MCRSGGPCHKIATIGAGQKEKAGQAGPAKCDFRGNIGKPAAYQVSGPFAAKLWTRKSMNARTFGWVKRPGG